MAGAGGYVNRPDRRTSAKAGFVGLLVATIFFVAPDHPIEKVVSWVLGGLLGPVSLLMLAGAAFPAAFETRIEVTDKTIVAKFPFKSLLTIPWERVSRIEAIPTGDGGYEDDVHFRIHWGNRKITLHDPVAFRSGLVKKMRALPNFSEGSLAIARSASIEMRWRPHRPIKLFER